MNIKKINLNLLQALDVLLTEASVTRAANHLFITQSAMSNALTQLRNLFDDELLVRGPKGMLLTTKAQQLQPILHKHISELQQLVMSEPLFDPKKSTRIFRIGMSDVAEFLLLPLLLERLAKEAPHIQLHITHLNHVTAYDNFIYNNVEMAVGCLVEDIAHIEKEKSFTFNSVVIARENHPLMQNRLTLAKYLKAKHIRVQYHLELGGTYIDKTLQNMGKTRQVVISLPHIMPILFMLQNTNLIASIPTILSAQKLKKLKLVSQPIPFKMANASTYTVWLRQQTHDRGLLWLRQLIKEVSDKTQQQIAQY